MDAVLSAADKFGTDGAEAGDLGIFDSAHSGDGKVYVNPPSAGCVRKRKAMVENAVRRLRDAAHALWTCEVRRCRLNRLYPS